ncbi:MAG: hypothetical protein DYG92_09490 [Leptolyngbya sp. PLA1]|nr:hypothetical protein [Leptolyngbya sp. PLA1]
MTVSRWRGLGWVLLAALAGPASAVQEGKSPPWVAGPDGQTTASLPPVRSGTLPPRVPVEVVRVDFGWDGVMPSDRWAPVVVWLWSGSGAFSGEITLRYKQDSTQRARITIPVSTTPGEVVPFELAACIPPDAAGSGNAIAELFVVDRGSSWEQEIKFVPVPSTAGEMWAPQIDDRSVRALVVGEVSAAGALSTGVMGPGALQATGAYPTASRPGATTVWDRLHVVRRAPQALPVSWLAYEGVDVIIASADELAEADPRVRAAIIEWVRWGGRLVLMVDGAGAWWREFVPTDQDVVLAADRGPARAPAHLFSRAETAQALEATTSPVSARLLEVTGVGRAEGWESFWEPEGAESGRHGLVARGPVGMGMVTLVGVDPARLPATVSLAGSRYLWRELLGGRSTGILPPELLESFEENQWGWWGYGSSGQDRAAALAIRTALDLVTVEPPVTDGTFVGIAAAMIILAGLVGPFDGIYLRRRGFARRTWLTALGWTLAATGLAYAVPSIIRTGRGSVGRCEVVDVLQAGPAAGGSQWRTGVSGVFSGRPMITRIEPRDGVWWRGISALESYRGNSRAFGPLELSPTFGTLRGMSARGFSQGQWTYRTLMDLRPAEPEAGPRCALSKFPDGWRADVWGLPEGTQVGMGMLSTSEGHWAMCFGPGTDEDGREAWSATTSGEPSSATPDLWAGPALEAAANPWMVTEATPADQAMGTVLRMPGSRARAQAVTARVTSGGWGVLQISVRGLPDGSGLQPGTEVDRKTLTLMRVLIPLHTEPSPSKDTP